MFKVLAVLQECIWEGEKIYENGDGNKDWSKNDRNQQVNEVLSFEVLSLVIDCNINCIYNNLKVQQRDRWDNECHGNDAVHEHHYGILQLKHCITQSCTSKEDDWVDQRKHQNVDREECKCGTTNKLIICNTVLQLDNVKSSVGIKVLEDLLVSVDEHSCK